MSPLKHERQCEDCIFIFGKQTTADQNLVFTDHDLRDQLSHAGKEGQNNER